MMSNRRRLSELYQRRADLLVRSAAQRAEFGEACGTWQLPLAIADKGVAAWRFAHKHPGLLVGVGVLFALTRPRLTLKWIQRGWSVWRVYRGLIGRRS